MPIERGLKWPGGRTLPLGKRKLIPHCLCARYCWRHGDTAVNKACKTPCPYGTYIIVAEKDNTQNSKYNL